MKKEKTQLKKVIGRIKSLYNPKNVEGMSRYGIKVANAYGVSMPVIRKMAKEIGKNHTLAAQLWSSGIHEAQIIACLIDDPILVDEKQMEKWAGDFDSWDLCDQCCSNLFDKTRFALKKVREWTHRDEEFVKRAGFVLMAAIAVHDKSAPDKIFIKFLPMIKKSSTDERNFVKKAVNWALRQIGKRNIKLNRAAIVSAREIKKIKSKSARWIAADALREFNSLAVKTRLKKYSCDC